MAAVGGVEVIDLGHIANEALTKYRFVKLTTTARTVDQCDTSGEDAIGVAQHDVEAADAAEGAQVNVRLEGISVVEAGAAVTLGDDIQTDASGRAITGVATNIKLGKALGAAAGAGDLIAVALAPPAVRITL